MTDLDPFEEDDRADAERRAAAAVDGKHYSTFADEVKQLLRAKHDDAAAGLLLRLVEAVEREAEIPRAGYGVPRWYHATLAAIYERAGAVIKAEKVLLRHQVVEAHAAVGSERARQRLHAAVTRPSEEAEPSTEPSALAKFSRWLVTPFFK